MNKLLVILTALFLLPVTLLAQNRTITGRVVDESGNPVVGANIGGKAAKKGVQTDNDGKFTISVSEPGSVNLTVSSVGFEIKIISVNGNDAGTVQLTKAVITQEDVVIVGYQTVKRKDLTGSVSSVNSRQIKDIPVNSASSK